MPAKRVILLDLVCLQVEHIQDEQHTPTLARLAREGWSAPLVPPTPAVTSTSLATLFTGVVPREHGVVGDGFYDEDRFRPRLWDQPIELYESDMVWEKLERQDWKTRAALLFFPNSVYTDVECVVTPAPIREPGGGWVPWCYSKPVGTYERLAERFGAFDPATAWGPLAGNAAAEWIARAAVDVAREEDPNLLAVRLPLLEFSGYRHGPDSPQFRDDLAALDRIVGSLLEELEAAERLDEAAVLLVSEFAMTPVSRPVYPNRLLREAGLLKVREIAGREYLDLELSQAFALVDHQVAHLYLKPDAQNSTHAAIWGQPGVEKLLYEFEKAELGLNHARSGQILAIADSDAWFAMDWWLEEGKAPALARVVDPTAKPGVDPRELLADPATGEVPLDGELVRGSHGRPHDREPKRPALIAHGVGLPRRPPAEVPMTAVADLIRGLLGQREAPPEATATT
jgi:hypothetical protein